MNPYALIDLHCDTLIALTDEDFHLLTAIQDPARREAALASLSSRVRGTDTLDLPGRHFSLSALPEGVRWCQCCAIFIPDGLSQEEAVAYYHLHQSNFHRQMETLTAKALPCRTAADYKYFLLSAHIILPFQKAPPAPNAPCRSASSGASARPPQYPAW